MRDENITALAKLLKERDNKEYIGVITGTIEQGFPDVKIRVDATVVLDNSHLIWARSLLTDRKRKCYISNPANGVPDHGLNGAEGEFYWTEELKVGDNVILLPTQNEQIYYVIDRVVVLDE